VEKVLGIAVILLLSGATVVGGCGSGGGGASVYRCDVVPDTCTEFDGSSIATMADVQAQQQSCVVQIGGAWAAGVCSFKQLGGCQVVAGEVTWYYPSLSFPSSSDVMQACQSAGGMFVPTP
jgi:hypothetical protein